MAKDDLAQFEGKVVGAGAGGIYKVKLENDVDISAKLCCKIP
jgi:translation initiation factor IF-1